MIRRLVERASVGPLLTFVFAPACGVPKPSRRVVSPELVALASEESMGTLTRISRLTALRKHLLWARNVIPRLSTSYPQYVDNLVDYPQNYPQNVDNLFFYPHFAFLRVVALTHR